MSRTQDAIYQFLSRRQTRYLLAWLLMAIVAAVAYWWSWTVFDWPDRPGGNRGHTLIDFGGQWLLGRMLVDGHGRHLYHRNYQWPVVQAAYPRSDEAPVAPNPWEHAPHEAEELMRCCMGSDSPKAAQARASFCAVLAGANPLAQLLQFFGVVHCAEQCCAEIATESIGGPLYPPIHALFMTSLARLAPARAYRIMQGIGFLCVAVAAAGIRLLSAGRIWFPVAVILVLLAPGCVNTINLGQNSVFALAVLIWGWTLLTRGHPVLGGMVWGLFSFKPVWAGAFLLVPLLMGQMQFCLAMVVTGAALAAATLPLVGLQGWLDWLQVAREAVSVYNTDTNWIFLSRDLLSIPRRWLLDFQTPEAERVSLAATVIGRTLLLTVIATTASISLTRKDRKQAFAGPPAAFLLFGAWLSCFHFMYYDVLLTLLPALLLVLEPDRWWHPTFVGVLPQLEPGKNSALESYYQPRVPAVYPPGSCRRGVAVLNSLTLSLIVLLWAVDLLLPGLGVTASVAFNMLERLSIPSPLKFTTSLTGPPWPTFVILVLWAWCGWLWLHSQRQTGTLEEKLRQRPAARPVERPCPEHA
jgi:hypothetical protein